MSSSVAPVAVIDIGSNSVRMVIYDVAHSPPVKIFNEKIVCGLGRDLGTTGRLNADATEIAFQALKAYKILPDIHRASHTLVVGTASLRDAVDGLDFIIRVKQDIGLDIRVITGDAEAGYAARGVLMFDRKADGVVADFGGGSLEFARISNDKISDTISLPLGAFRVQSMGEGAADSIHQSLSPLVSRFGNLKNLYAIGGSWRVLASAHMLATGHKQDLQGYSVTSSDMILFCREIQKMDVDSIIGRFRMEMHHAKLAHIAAFTLELTLKDLAPDNFVVSTAGVRDGVVHEFLLSQPKKR